MHILIYSQVLTTCSEGHRSLKAFHLLSRIHGDQVSCGVRFGTSGVKDVVLGHARRWGQIRGNQEVERGFHSMKAAGSSS